MNGLIVQTVSRNIDYEGLEIFEAKYIKLLMSNDKDVKVNSKRIE